MIDAVRILLLAVWICVALGFFAWARAVGRRPHWAPLIGFTIAFVAIVNLGE